jgi:hypothetical protein
MAFQDVGWVNQHTNSTDAFGFIGYNLLFALIESVLTWIFLLALNFLLPKQWGNHMRIAQLGTILFILSAWALFGQLLIISDPKIMNILFEIAKITNHPSLVLQGTVIVIVTLSLVLPIFILAKYPRVRKIVIAIYNRIIVLSGFYLILDFFGIIIIINRILF